MKTNNQKGSILSIVEIIVVLALIVVGGVYYFSQRNNIKPLTKDVRVAAEYQVLNDESSWRAKNIVSNLPMQWNVTEKSIILKEVEQNKFMCGDREAQFIKYSAFNNGSIGGWDNISVVDCLDYYFVYEYGDAGPKLYGPFSKDGQINVIVGGDQDAHGCIPSAGYLWSDTKQACVRPWEENQATSSPINSPSNPIACTMDAKACPDGSYVGRSGPKCEFKVCPSNTTPAFGVTSPSYGESWVRKTVRKIMWQGFPAETVSIYIKIPCQAGYSCDTFKPYNGNFTVVKDITNTGSYSWLVGQTIECGAGDTDQCPVPNTGYEMKICSTDGNTCSISNFTITK